MNITEFKWHSDNPTTTETPPTAANGTSGIFTPPKTPATQTDSLIHNCHLAFPTASGKHCSVGEQHITGKRWLEIADNRGRVERRLNITDGATMTLEETASAGRALKASAGGLVAGATFLPVVGTIYGVGRAMKNYRQAWVRLTADNDTISFECPKHDALALQDLLNDTQRL